MKKTKLVEFKNESKTILRGVLLSCDKPKGAVIMCGGFERSTTTEKKFKLLADQLIENSYASLRFDFSGCGLSDGDFSKITVARLAAEITLAIKLLQKNTKTKKISIVAHSLSTCAVALLINKLSFDKIILIAPALNQKDLLRFWFVTNQMKKRTEIQIAWNNYKKYLNEIAFINDGKQPRKITKTNYLAPNYFLENQLQDYSTLIKSNNILVIHGDSDDKVPLQSLKINFKKRIIVKNGDHDLERPDMIDQWLKPVINFLI